MSEVLNQINNSDDKVATLMKEAENLKQKLEEERQKLNDVTCEIFSCFLPHIEKKIFFFSIINC